GQLRRGIVMRTLTDGRGDGHLIGNLRIRLRYLDTGIFIKIKHFSVVSQPAYRLAVGEDSVFIQSHAVGNLTHKYVAGIGDTAPDIQKAMPLGKPALQRGTRNLIKQSGTLDDGVIVDDAFQQTAHTGYQLKGGTGR